MLRVIATLACFLALAGCASGKVSVDMAKQNAAANARAEALGPEEKGTGGERCNAGAQGREVSEYDTSGDGVPDVRKVYAAAGTGVEARLVMICRETDLNSDGRKDVIRYYDDEGRTLREDADRNFDGKMDLSVVFQDGRVVRKELDTDLDGRLDTKVFFEGNLPLRTERDLAGRSTPDKWHPDQWEYFEEGRMVRSGTDLDGDSRVDRWDRDQQFKDEQRRAREEAEAKAVAAAAAEAAATAPSTDSAKSEEAKPQK
jgi:hypothetical protein